MNAYGRNSKLATYQSVAVHGGVTSGDPHKLVLMLMDGALERLAMARGCIERGDIGKKAQLLARCTSIITELRGSLDLTKGGSLAHNLSDLYEYMMRQLLRANADGNVAFVNEVISLMGEIRSAWVAISPEVRQAASSGSPGA